MRHAETPASLRPLEWVERAVWVFDITQRRMWWANPGACRLWQAESSAALLERDFGDMSAETAIRLDGYLERLRDGQTIRERWTFYPHGTEVAVRCKCTPLWIESPRRLAMLVEGMLETENSNQILALEALRHTHAAVCLFTLSGEVLYQNPRDIEFFRVGTRLNDRFADVATGRPALVKAVTGDLSSSVLEMRSDDASMWCGLEIRRIRDPVDGSMRLLVRTERLDDLRRRFVETRRLAGATDATAPERAETE